jgi:hypothetical protein
MKKSFVWASIILIGLLTGTKTEASARRFYLELLGAIDHAQAKARLFLDAGTWRSGAGFNLISS